MISAKRVYAMLENETLWETTTRCHQLLSREGIAHAIVGGVAVCLHGYQCNTIDLDLLVRPSDGEMVREVFSRDGIEWNTGGREFRTPSGVAVQLLCAGERAGDASQVERLPGFARRRATVAKPERVWREQVLVQRHDACTSYFNHDAALVLLPDPGDPKSTTEREGLPVVSLARLIEAKIACGEGNVRRTHRDFADVVELIIANGLDRSFAQLLHGSMRKTYRKLVLDARGEE